MALGAIVPLNKRSVMTILITGATGLVGREVVKLCRLKGINVHFLTSSKSKLVTEEYYKGFFWDIETNQIDLNCFEGVSVIIHLAGASISKRWTNKYKKEIINSRVKSTQLLQNSIESQEYPIKHFISASAIGLYPSSQTHFYEETVTKVSKSFLGDVVNQWETSVDQLKDGSRLISKVRIGLVLSEKGGALPEIIKPVKIGLGAAFGKGEQWQSWIHIQDLAAIFLFIVEQELEGVFNAVAPNPVSNNELTKLVAKVLNKPLFMPNIPRLAMQLMLGDMSMLLFESQRVSCQKIEGEGFQFQFSNLQLALSDLILNTP